MLTTVVTPEPPMHPGALRALEFDRIVERVGRWRRRPLARAARLARWHPLTRSGGVAGARRDRRDRPVSPRHRPDRPARARRASRSSTALAVDGRALEPLHLLGVWPLSSRSVDASVTGIRRSRGRSRCSGRWSTGPRRSSARSRTSAARSIRRGEVVDEASPELKSIRDRLRKQRTRLRGTLESYLRGQGHGEVPAAADRHRPQRPLRAGRPRGTPHGDPRHRARQLGERREPVSRAAEHGRDQQRHRRARAAGAEEVHRILLALSDAFADARRRLHRTIDAATALDVLQARRATRSTSAASRRRLSPDGRLELRGARHPLLIARGIEVTPVDVLLIPPARSLVITGPNTGGKTVALKTAGLLPLMAQSGLLIPVDGRHAGPGPAQRVRRHRRRAVDRREPQHLLVAHRERRRDGRGAGRCRRWCCSTRRAPAPTRSKGGALAMAIIDHFRRRGARWWRRRTTIR